ncbi:MAG TPA: class I SAM-dependent methyltransferase [Acidobacteriaceae bacterium]|nr:class I SAM-dependent methyltransferase [Acidobacteriaceae bacterium]
MTRFGRAWRKVQWSLRQRGVMGTARQALQRTMGSRGTTKPALHPFDEEHGTDTSGLVSGGGLFSGHAHDRFSVAYYGVSPSRMRRAVARWRETAGTGAVDDYTFVDIGSGKGRAMMLASELPFREVVGVELSASLCQVAEKNLEMWRASGRALSPMRLVQGDALGLRLPEGRLLIFMYNPFLAPMMRRLLERVAAAAGGRRGEIDLLYVVPQQEAVFAEFPGFELLWSERVGMSEVDAAADHVSSPEDRVNLYRR